MTDAELDEEDAKLVVLARGAMARTGVTQRRRSARRRRSHLRRVPGDLSALQPDSAAGGRRGGGVQRGHGAGGRRGAGAGVDDAGVLG